MQIVLEVLLSVLFLSVIIIDSAANVLPAIELKRRLNSDWPGKFAGKNIFKFLSYGKSGFFVLWLIGTASAGAMIVWASKGSYFASAILTILISALTIMRHKIVSPD